MKPSRQAFAERLTKALGEYIADEEAYGDAPQLRINPREFTAEVIADPDEDLPEFDYYDAIDMLVSADDGHFGVDPEAVEEVAAEYVG